MPAVNSPPRHVAIIMDGNGRWAKSRNLKTIQGHKAGGERVECIAIAAQKVGVSYLTLYTFSTENFKRSPVWIAELMREFTYYLEHKTDIFLREKIRAYFIGDRSLFSGKIQKLMSNLEEKTAHFEGLQVNFAFGYGGRHELMRAIQKIARDVQHGLLYPTSINEALIAQYLDTADIPDPDLFIRTSGDMRISNYLLWQLAYTEMHFSPTLWPDFTEAEFHQILTQFQKRERCYGQDRHAA